MGYVVDNNYQTGLFSTLDFLASIPKVAKWPTGEWAKILLGLSALNI